MAVEKTGDVCPSMGVTDGLLEIDVKSFYVFYTHSMIDVSERRIMYGTYSQVRFVPRTGMFLLPLCDWLLRSHWFNTTTQQTISSYWIHE